MLHALLQALMISRSLVMLQISVSGGDLLKQSVHLGMHRPTCVSISHLHRHP